MPSPPRKNARPGATIRQVADLAGVSLASVSRVLNGGYTSKPLKAQVLAAMAKLDYTPSAAAMNFAAGRTGVIGVIANYIDSEWIPLVLRGIERSISADRRASLLIGSLNHGDDYDSSAIRSWLEGRRIDGAIFLRPQKSERSLINLARKKSIPFAALSPDLPMKEGVDLRSDNTLGGKLLATHLLDAGHEHFAFVGGEETSSDCLERLSGVRDTLREAGCPLKPKDIFYGPYEIKQGRAFAERWLKRSPGARPSAVLCADDTIAIGFVATLLQHGIRIPDEVSVTGYNNMPTSEWLWPGLTTVSQGLPEIGEKAADLVVAAAFQGEDFEEPRLVFPVELVVRQSTGPAPSRRSPRADRRSKGRK